MTRDEEEGDEFGLHGGIVRLKVCPGESLLGQVMKTLKAMMGDGFDKCRGYLYLPIALACVANIIFEDNPRNQQLPVPHRGSFRKAVSKMESRAGLNISQIWQTSLGKGLLRVLGS
jgi:hypothetical protein